MNNKTQMLLDKISSFKVQRIINKNLYKESIITIEMYEQVESNLLEKIETFSNELEMKYSC